MMTFGAVLLAGGRATRVDGAAKPLFDIGGRTLLHRAVEAVSDAGASPITIVGPDELRASLTGLSSVASVECAREEPPFSGPAAGVVAALATWQSDPAWTFVFACDLARPDLAVAQLVADLPLLPRGSDGVCLADASSRPQWLTGVYRTARLRAGAAALPDAGRDASMRALLDDLAITAIVAPEASVDIDTWEDLSRAKERNDG